MDSLYIWLGFFLSIAAFFILARLGTYAGFKSAKFSPPPSRPQQEYDEQEDIEQALKYWANTPPQSHYPENWKNGIYLSGAMGRYYSKQKTIEISSDIPEFFTEQGHIVTVAGSRSGKGASQIIPNLLMEFENSYIVIDIKGENAAVTARYQTEIGKNVYIIDPWNEQKRLGATHNINPSGFNPLHGLDLSSPDIIDDLTSIIEACVPIPKGVDDYWYKRARVLIRGLALEHMYKTPSEKWSLYAVFQYLRKPSEELMATLKLCCDLAKDDLAQFQDIDPLDNKMFGSILDTARSSTEFMRIFENTDSLQKTFNPEILNKPTTVYLVIPFEKMENYSSWLRLMITSILVSTRKTISKRRIVFMLDEFPQLGRMDNIAKGMGLMAGYNITFWIFVQNLKQLSDIYGSNWDVFMDVKAKLFYKITEPFTAEYVSKLFGHERITKQSKTTSSGGMNQSQSTTVSESTEIRYHPNEVIALTNKECVLFRDGIDETVYWFPYFSLLKFDGRYDKNPLI